jgi:hypothetical protein
MIVLNSHEGRNRSDAPIFQVTVICIYIYRPSDRRLSAMLVPIFADRGCHVVSVTDPYGRTLGFLDRSRYFFFQVAPQLHSRG